MPLRHIAIPSWPRTTPPRYPTYALATRVQSRLQKELLAWKALKDDPWRRLHAPPPLPTLVSFIPAPTYTLGRRQTEPLSASEFARLRAPLSVSLPSRNDHESITTAVFAPEVLHAPRGGLTTYHGPGQAVLWPVIDLRSPLHAHFSVRDYTCLLEKTTIATLRRVYGVAGFTTSNPGVWVRKDDDLSRDEEKISALGVHLRRHVTGLGVAVNVGVSVTGTEETNPWARIVACGLGDRSVTSIAAQLDLLPTHEIAPEDIAAAWAAEFAERLELPGAAVEEEDWETWEKELQLEPVGPGTDAGFIEGQVMQS
ncbi:putative octanoyltransferase [Daldinia childiae]|uniref:putative octanoyltransferase n=1 Tax=Daldinia childiae TaxID=326645 RepID=UPI001445D282|nr:putative octanoyltransferase [Daldinia childiae]KAF3069127.1 putative octanoyltransferase [Daldinia childiae]